MHVGARVVAVTVVGDIGPRQRAVGAQDHQAASAVGVAIAIEVAVDAHGQARIAIVAVAASGDATGRRGVAAVVAVLVTHAQGGAVGGRGAGMGEGGVVVAVAPRREVGGRQRAGRAEHRGRTAAVSIAVSIGVAFQPGVERGIAVVAVVAQDDAGGSGTVVVAILILHAGRDAVEGRGARERVAGCVVAVGGVAHVARGSDATGAELGRGRHAEAVAIGVAVQGQR